MTGPFDKQRASQDHSIMRSEKGHQKGKILSYDADVVVIELLDGNTPPYRNNYAQGTMTSEMMHSSLNGSKRRLTM